MIYFTKHKAVFMGGFILLTILLLSGYLVSTTSHFSVITNLAMYLFPSKPKPLVNVPPKVITPTHIYTITSITSNDIYMATTSGTFDLPYTTMTVEIYKGVDRTFPKLFVSELKVGDKVTMELIPGKSATPFVYQL